jgi:CBS domain-containing protein
MAADDRAFPVVDGAELLGIVTLEDIRRVDRANWPNTTVLEIMTPRNRLVTVEAADDAADAMTSLMQRDVNQLPVVEGGQLVGLLRREDIIRWLRIQRSSV